MHYCKCAGFTNASFKSKLCSNHFSNKEQFAVNPETYTQYGYENTKRRCLKEDAVPDIPIEVRSSLIRRRTEMHYEICLNAIKRHYLQQDQRWYTTPNFVSMIFSPEFIFYDKRIFYLLGNVDI